MLSKQKIKYIQSLGQKKFRREEGVFIAEGPKLVEEILTEQPAAVSAVYALPEWATNHPRLAAQCETVIIRQEELERITQLSTPHQVVAVVKQFAVVPFVSAKDRFTLALDDIRDPGNFGTLVRIADWFGIGSIVCSEDCADIYNPKVVQATMGSIARVKIVYTNLADWLAAQSPVPVFAAMLEGKNVYGITPVTEGILVVGNESKGISPDIAAIAAEHISIPRKGKAESLNAAVATGIILSHLLTGNE